MRTKYCYNCNRNTVGEPLFCNFCGRSYDVKLCPKLHLNPRYAEACSLCGSRELSIPQPTVPFWARLLLVVLILVPGVFLSVLSVVLILLAIRQFNSPDRLAGPGVLLGILWAAWSRIPALFHK